MSLLISRYLKPILLPSFVLLLASGICSACSANSGDTVVPTRAKPTATTNELAISARDFSFVPSELNAFNNRPMTIVLTNDGTEQHSLSVYEDDKYERLVAGAVIDATKAGSSNQVTFAPPKKPQTLYFRCEIHPDLMHGEISIADKVN